jgi:hypothetical protein
VKLGCHFGPFSRAAEKILRFSFKYLKLRNAFARPKEAGLDVALRAPSGPRRGWTKPADDAFEDAAALVGSDEGSA